MIALIVGRVCVSVRLGDRISLCVCRKCVRARSGLCVECIVGCLLLSVCVSVLLFNWLCSAASTLTRQYGVWFLGIYSGELTSSTKMLAWVPVAA